MAEQAAAPMVYDFDDIYTFPTDGQSQVLNEPYPADASIVNPKKRKMYKTKFDSKSHKKKSNGDPAFICGKRNISYF